MKILLLCQCVQEFINGNYIINVSNMISSMNGHLLMNE